MLKIRTGGLVSPAGARAWINEWIEAPEAEQLDLERWGELEEVGRWWEDSLVDIGDSGDLDTLFGRAIFIDGFLCQIMKDGSLRSALLSDVDGSPMFFNISGTVDVGNNRESLTTPTVSSPRGSRRRSAALKAPGTSRSLRTTRVKVRCSSPSLGGPRVSSGSPLGGTRPSSRYRKTAASPCQAIR